AFPDIDAERAPIVSIPGTPPNLVNPPAGCRFHPRCPLADEACRRIDPELAEKGRAGHKVACLKVSDDGQAAEVTFACTFKSTSFSKCAVSSSTFRCGAA